MKIKEHPLNRTRLIKIYDKMRILTYKDLTDDEKEYEIVDVFQKDLLGSIHNIVVVASAEMIGKYGLQVKEYNSEVAGG